MAFSYQVWLTAGASNLNRGRCAGDVISNNKEIETNLLSQKNGRILNKEIRKKRLIYSVLKVDKCFKFSFELMKHSTTDITALVSYILVHLPQFVSECTERNN